MSTDLARLVVALEAQTAKYQEGLDTANRKLSKFARDHETLLGSIEKQFSSFGGKIHGALAGLIAGISFEKIIEATSEAEHATALLENAVRASGGAAGYTTEQLSDMAKQLQAITTYDSNAIKGAEQLLLRFQSIRGVNFKNATKSTLDLAAALGKDLPEAAVLVGKALEDPEKGLTQLARAGVVFSNEQKRTVQGLLDTGQTAKAQGVILQELENRYGGAAEAARNTFGGALKALHNAFSDLLEGKSGMEEATTAINELTDTLNSPEVKQGFEIIVSGFAKVIEFAAKAAARIADVAKSTGQFFGELVSQDNGAGLDDSTRAARIANIGKMLDQLAKGWDKISDSAKEARSRQIDKLEAMLEQLKKQQMLMADVVPGKAAADPAGKPLGPVEIDPRKDSALAELKFFPQKDPLGLNNPMAKFYEQLQQDSQTATEKQLADFAKVESALNELYNLPLNDPRHIGPDEYAKRFNEAFDKMIPEVEVTAKKIGPTLIAQFDYVGKALRQFVQQTNDIIAGGLEDAMNGHFDNIFKSFEHLIQQMVAKSIAADITGALFGEQGGGKGQGYLGGALDFLGKALFGGSKDVGGDGQAGKVYKIGTGAQPEYFHAPADGQFYPRGEGMGGGAVVNQAIYVQGVLDERTARQIQLDAARKQRQAMRLS